MTVVHSGLNNSVCSGNERVQEKDWESEQGKVGLQREPIKWKNVGTSQNDYY